MNIDYRAKYDKYNGKIKILQEGMGKKDSQYYFFIATHDNRLQCMLKQIYGQIDKNYKTKRLQNCAILKVTYQNKILKIEMIHSGEILKKPTEDKKSIKKEVPKVIEPIKDFWRGDDEKKEEDEDEIKNEDRFNFSHKEINENMLNKIYVPGTTKSKNPEKLLDVLYPNVTLFLIRHGNGFHNMDLSERKKIAYGDIAKIVIGKKANLDITHDLLDAHLTDNGIQQAKNAAV